MDLWGNIEKIIQNNELTAKELAIKANISPNTLYELKSGRNKDLQFKTICKIADALDISLDEFRKD